MRHFSISGTARSYRQAACVGWVIASCAGGMNILGDNTPPSPDKPWSPPRLQEYEDELKQMRPDGKGGGLPVVIDPEKVYDLPELIDIAERANPKTRIAWERARQAAAAVGLSQSAYYPYLVASAGAGYERAFLPFPTLQQGPGTDVSITGGGTLITDTVAGRAAVGVKWLLFDFGGRKAEVAMAKEGLMAANVGFNALHQQIVFAVTHRFYEVNTARQKVAVAEGSVRATEVVARSAQARFDHGLAIKPETLEAEQQSAQAAFDLAAARGSLSDAQVGLADSLGIEPTAKLQIAEVSENPPFVSAEEAEELIDRALSQRPDLVAKLAQLHAKQAEVKRAKAAYYPKIAVDAHAGWAGLDVSIRNSSYFGGSDPVYAAGLSVELPLFDGFARRNGLRIAESELREAEADLADSRDSVVREVWKARTDLETALSMQDAAAKLLAAAESAFSASLDAYRQGVGTYVDVANAQRNVSSAKGVVVDTRSAIYTAVAGLALAVGDLAKPPGSPSQKPR